MPGIGHNPLGRLRAAFLCFFLFFDCRFPDGSGEKCNFSPTIEILCMFSSDPFHTMEDMRMSETWVPREELEGLIGRDGAALLCREAGGVPIYVPVKTNPACRLGRILPQRQLAALVAAYGGTMIAVPNGKFRPHKDVILKRLAQGEPHARIALDVGVTERYVRQLASRKARNRQLSLF